VALFYVIAAGCWILFSDRLASLLISNPDWRTWLSTIKGWGFVLVTGVLLYQMLRYWLKQMEQEEKQREAAVADLRRSERALRTISDCNQVLVRANTEAELLPEICRVAVEKSGYRLAWVGFAENDEKKSIRIAAHSGYNEGYLEQLQLTWADTELGCGPTGTALRTGQVAFSNDYRTDPQVAFWRSAALQRGYASLIALPLRNGENTLGVLTLYATETDFFSATEINLLMELAGDLAYGILALRTRQEYRQAEEKVRILSRAMEQSPTAIIITNVAGAAEYVNTAFTRMTGYTLEEEIGKSQRELLSGSQSSENHEKLWAAITAGQIWSGELRNRRKNGELFWERGMVSPIMDQNGRITHYIANKVDITAYKQAEEALRESEEKYRLLVENAHEAIYVVQQGILQFANRKALDLSGQHDPRKVVGRSMLDFITPEDQATAEEHHQRLLRGEITESQQEYRLRSGVDTPLRWLYVSAVRILWHGQPATLNFATDITGRKEAEATLRESEEQLSKMFNASPVAISLTTIREGRYLNANDEFLKMLGLSREEVIGHTVFEFDTWVTPEKRDVIIAQLKQHGAVRNVELEFRRRSGQICQILWSVEEMVVGGESCLLGLALNITELKRDEEALRESREQFQDLFENAPVGFHEIDAEGRVVRINKTELQMLGYSAGELLGQFVWKISDQVEISHRAALAKLAGQPPPPAFERRFRRKDGSTFPVLINDRILKREDGAIIGIRAAVQDITERKHAEAALRESEQKFSKMFHASPIAILLTTIKEGRFLDANEECLRMLGRTREEVIGHTVFEFDAWVDPEQRAAIIAKLKEHGTVHNLEMEFRSRSGQVCHALGSVEELVVGGESCLLGLGLDITERKRAEEANARLVTAVEQVADTVVITDITGAILYANPAFEKTSGYSRVEALGHNPRLLKSGRHDALFYRQMWDTLVRGETWNGHFVNKRKDGTLYEEEATISPIRDKQGNLVNYVAVKHDVTHELQLEAQFRQAQKMEAIGQLAGGIAHDFNNILTAMFGYGYLLQQDLAQNPSSLENITEILKAAKRAQDLVQQILTFSRQRENRRQVVPLKAIIEEAMKFLRASLPVNIKIEMHLADGAPAVLADPTQIYQVTMNLATNALHAMEGQPGRLTVSLDSFQPDAEFIRTHPQFRCSSYARMMVADTGQGMDAKTLERIFEPFFTTKAVGKGTGLGLAVVHGVVQSHHGIITVESQPGQGTTFSLYFPAHAPGAAVNGAKNSNAVPGHGERILPVDDETSLTTLFQRLLTSLNYQATICNLPREAADLFRHDPDQFDLVITDLTMPEMNGLELAHEIHALRPHLPVILLSGFSAAFTHETLREAGIHKLLNKPVSLSVLAETLHTILAPP
jgi:PAS domain S-box-containing protein